jgi:hypothetical protein
VRRARAAGRGPRVRACGCGPRARAGGRARAAEPMRSHPTHQSHRPHLRGTSGFRGNFGQLWATGVAQMFRNGPIFRGKFRIAEPRAHLPSRPGGPWDQRDARDRRTAAGTGRARPGLVHGPAWCAPGDTAIRPQINARPPPPQLSGTGPLSTGTPRTRATARITRTSLVPDPHHSVSVIVAGRRVAEGSCLSSALVGEVVFRIGTTMLRYVQQRDEGMRLIMQPQGSGLLAQIEQDVLDDEKPLGRILSGRSSTPLPQTTGRSHG